MKKISLTQGKFAIVDDLDFEWLSNFKWRLAKSGRTFYAIRWSPRNNGKRHLVQMHREILGLSHADKRLADHINGNGLCNLRSNLRSCNKLENCFNRRSNIASSSIFKGVRWDQRAHKWRVAIKHSGKIHNLGFFSNEIEAAKIYDKQAIIYFGQFARPNFKRDNCVIASC